MTIPLRGRIDSLNAPEVERALLSRLEGEEGASVVLDAAELDYISSAGLRVLLRLKKLWERISIVNVCSQVYEILEMTGFTEMMPVEKAYRRVSVEGCEVIGEGANGRVYRIDRDNVVKTYKNADALESIRHEREVARLALILGVPTAISYDVVRVGDSYGSVFELLNARSFARILAEEPEKLDWCVKEYVEMLRKLHGIHVPPGKLPAMKTEALGEIGRMKGTLPASYGEKLERLVTAIPQRDTLIHGDYHTKNIVLADGEVLLIDMDTLSVGHPIFELEQMYSSFIGYAEYDPGVVLRFQGYPMETAREFWKRSLRAYLAYGEEDAVTAVEEKVRCLSYARMIHWGLHQFAPGDEGEQATLRLWTGELLELLDRVDDLDFEAQGGPQPSM